MTTRRVVLSCILLLLVVSIVSSVPVAAVDHKFIVSIGIDNSTYKPGDTVTIVGLYKCSICGKGAVGRVSIQISTPTGLFTVPPFDTNEGGYYSKSIHISEKATPGVYTITVTVSKSGYADATNRKQFNVSSGKLAMSVETDRGTYRPPAVVTVWGFVDCDNEGVPAATVTITASTPTGADRGPWTVTTDEFGYYKKGLSLSKNAGSGTYVVYATASKNGYTGDAGHTSFTVESKPKSLSITIKANRQGYTLGEVATFTGRVTCENAGVEGIKVEIVITDSAGKAGSPGTSYTDSGGYFKGTAKISKDVVPGPRTVTATASKEGYKTATARTTFVINARLRVGAIALRYKDEPLATVSGRVWCDDTSDSVEGAKVTITITHSETGKRWTYEVVSGSDGRFSFRFLIDKNTLPGHYGVEVLASKDYYYKSGYFAGSFEVGEP